MLVTSSNADAFLLSSQANQMAEADNQYMSSLVDDNDNNQLNEGKGDLGMAISNQMNAI